MACYNCSEYWQLWVKNLVVVLSHVMSQKTMFLVLFSITVCGGGCARHMHAFCARRFPWTGTLKPGLFMVAKCNWNPLSSHSSAVAKQSASTV